MKDPARGTIGVYAIVDPVGAEYVGSSTCIATRWREHRRQLRAGRHFNASLQAAWRQHCGEGFDFQVLQIVDAEADLAACEQYWLDLRKPKHNLAPVAGRAFLTPERVEELRRKARAARIAIGRTLQRDYEVALERCERLYCSMWLASRDDPRKVSPKAADRFRRLLEQAKLGHDPFCIDQKATPRDASTPKYDPRDMVIYLASHAWIDKVQAVCDSLVRKSPGGC